MTTFAAFADVLLVSGDLVVPSVGAWSANVMFAGDQDIPDSGDITIGNLTLHGTVFRQSPYGGSREALLVGGGDGWRKEVSARHYRLSSGVRRNIILQDAAAEVGEAINVPGSDSVGTDYVRSKGPASRVLRELVGDEWYIDAQGVTQLGARPTTAVTSPFVVVNQRGGAGLIEIATEDYASWLPNASFSSPFLAGSFTVNAARYSFQDDGTARLEVMT